MANKSFKDVANNRQQILEENNNKSTVPKAEPTLTEFDLIMGVEQDKKIDQEKTTPGKITTHENTQTGAEPISTEEITKKVKKPKREILIATRLTKEQHAELKHNAKKYGYESVSDFAYYLLTKDLKK